MARVAVWAEGRLPRTIAGRGPAAHPLGRPLAPTRHPAVDTVTRFAARPLRPGLGAALRGALRPGRTLTVVLVPDDSGRPRTLRVPLRPLQVGAAAAGLVLAVSLGGSALAVHSLAAQNSSLRGTLDHQVAVAATARQVQLRAEAESAYFGAQASALSQDARKLASLESSAHSILAAAGIRVPPPPSGKGGGGAVTLRNLPAVAPGSAAPSRAELDALARQAGATNLGGAPIPNAQVASQVLEARRVLGTIGGEIPALGQDLRALAHSLGGWQRAAMNTPSIWPVTGPITSPFGWRPNPFGHGPREFHDGVDIGVPVGTHVHATADGVVAYAGWYGAYGIAVIINHGNGLQTLYGHNSRILVRVGQQVIKGQVISLSGDTGRSTGPHVHYGVYRNGTAVNPATYLPGD